jgi:chromosome segregation ATPase
MNSSRYTFDETLSDKMDDSGSDNNKMMYDPETDENIYNECFPQTTKKYNDMKSPENSSLTEIMEQTSETLKTMSKEFNEMNDQNRKLQDENNKLKEDCDNLYREKQSIERNFSRAKDYYESKIKDLELNDQIKKLLNENNKLKEDNDNLLRENQILKQNLAGAKSKLQQINETNPQKIHDQTELITTLQNQLSDKENNIRDLINIYYNLKDEA